MTDTPQEIAVSQAAREAAADFSDAEARLWSMGDESAHSGPMRRGERDDSLTVQAFAAFEHRIASQTASPNTGGIAEAARALVAKLDECQPHIDNVFTINWTRSGVQYTGPTYGEELTALRLALTAAPKPTKGEQP